jgi:FixJ family two-component response regulator
MYQYSRSYSALEPSPAGIVAAGRFQDIDPASSIRSASRAQTSAQPIVFIVGAEIADRDDLGAMARAAGWRSRSFPSLSAYLAHAADPGPGCLVLDASGAGAADPLLAAVHRLELPVICLTAAGDVPTTVRAMKAGALDVFAKPILAETLVDVMRQALDVSAATQRQGLEMRQLHERYGSLSHREREVMALVVTGLLNKQVAGELGISEITVKSHRGRVMRKMQATSFASLIRMAGQLAAAAVTAGWRYSGPHMSLSRA